jgi:hypothetical protein
MKMMDNKDKDIRPFEYEGQKYKVVRPTQKVRRESDAIYAQAFKQAVQDGFFLEVEIEELLEGRGLDEKTVSRKKNELIKQIRTLEVKLAKRQYKNVEEGRELAFRVADLRNSLENVDSGRKELKTQLASTVAENKRFNFFAYKCVTSEDGKPLWADFDEYENDDTPLAYLASIELASLLYNITRESIDKLSADYTENSWLRQNKFMDEKLRLINDKGKLIDRDGRLVNEEGYFVDENGNRVDIFGNRLTEDGHILSEEKVEKVESPPKNTPQEVMETVIEAG